MTAPLSSFLRALQLPDVSLVTLFEARAVVDSRGMPALIRTTRFAEAEIEWHGQRWLLSLPLTPSGLRAIEQTASRLRRLNTELLTRYLILPDEMHWQDGQGTPRTCDLILQHLPPGKSFAEALLCESQERLSQALSTLESGLRELGFAHNNLKAENLRWCGGRLIPLRYHDARMGNEATFEGDMEAFKALHREVRDGTDTQSVHDVTAPYQPQHTLPGHLWTSHLFEGLVCVEDASGYGYVDAGNNPVIPSRFLWAGDFHEGRAEVETEQGMGLIDTRGNYIIAPHYEIVDYDPATSTVHVRKDGLWALFDYMGCPQTEFGTRYERE